jgi:hypothetical protein
MHCTLSAGTYACVHHPAWTRRRKPHYIGTTFQTYNTYDIHMAHPGTASDTRLRTNHGCWHQRSACGLERTERACPPQAPCASLALACVWGPPCRRVRRHPCPQGVAHCQGCIAVMRPEEADNAPCLLYARRRQAPVKQGLQHAGQALAARVAIRHRHNSHLCHKCCHVRKLQARDAGWTGNTADIQHPQLH